MDRTSMLAGLVVVLVTAEMVTAGEPTAENRLIRALEEVERRLQQQRVTSDVTNGDTSGDARAQPDVTSEEAYDVDTRAMRRPCRRRPCKLLAMLNNVPAPTKRAFPQPSSRLLRGSRWHDTPLIPGRNSKRESATAQPGKLTCDQVSKIHQMFLDDGDITQQAKEDFDVACELYSNSGDVKRMLHDP